MYFIKIIVPLSNYFLSFPDNVLTFMVNEDLLKKQAKNTKMFQYWEIKQEKRIIMIELIRVFKL